MYLENINNEYFLKMNDSLTEVHLVVRSEEGELVDLTAFPVIEVVIGTEEGRTSTKTPTFTNELGELHFRLDVGDLYEYGDNRLEIHLYEGTDTLTSRKHNIPSKGYYKLRIQQPIDGLAQEVTTYTLDYFLNEVAKATADAAGLVHDLQDIRDDLDDVIPVIPELQELVAEAPMLVNTVNTATQSAISAAQNANDAATRVDESIANAIDAAQEATDAATDANAAATLASEAAVNADNAAQDATNAASLANTAAGNVAGWGTTTTWSSSVQYRKNNTVTYNGSAWQAKRDNIGVTPVNGNDWILIAQRGLDGSGSIVTVNELLPDLNGNIQVEMEHITGLQTALAEAGKVKTVNNTLPDASGNINVDAGLQTGNKMVEIARETAQKPPSYYYDIGQRTHWENWQESTLDIPDAQYRQYAPILTICPFNTATSDKITQVAYTQHGIYSRSSVGDVVSTATWGDWSKITTDADLSEHMSRTDNPHNVTKEQVGLGNVDNTSDLNKPISTAVQNALNTKADTNAIVAHTANSTIHLSTADRAKLSGAFQKDMVLTTDWNLATDTGHYYGTVSSLNRPPVDTVLQGVVYRYNENYTVQEVWQVDQAFNRRFRRFLNGGIWMQWMEINDTQRVRDSAVAGVGYPDPNTCLEPMFITDHANMGEGNRLFWFVEQIFYTTTGNRTQKASTYHGSVADFKVRHYNDGVWSPWSSSLYDLFTSVSNGKSLVANAITQKGVATSATAEFATMANNISQIYAGYKVAVGSGTVAASGNGFTINGNTAFRPYIVNIQYDDIYKGGHSIYSADFGPSMHSYMVTAEGPGNYGNFQSSITISDSGFTATVGNSLANGVPYKWVAFGT